ncbi:MAG: sulfite exporter TauE/SafE family protein [Pseudomonadota bacterium]
MPTDTLTSLAPLLGAGLAAGLVAGLLGVGGGIVMVPILSLVLPALGADEAVSMHMAVASSLAVIVLTSLVSARAHAKRGGVDLETARLWALPIAAGALAGALAARYLSGDALRVLFAVLAAAVGTRFLLGRPAPEATLNWSRTLRRIAATVIGVLSAWLGIGGGTFAVPVLHGVGLPMHRAVGTAALLGFFVALPGAIGFGISGLSVDGRLAHSVGYLHLPAVLVLASGAVLLAPVGARLAHAMPQLQLRRVFGVFLLLAAASMMSKALA